MEVRLRLGWILLVILALGPAAAVSEDSSSALQGDQIEQWNIFNADNSDLPSDDVTAVLAADGALWAGTKGGGLARLEQGQWQVYTTANSSLPDDNVMALAAADGALWVGTGGGGLARLENGQWQVYTKANSKLSSDNVQALAAAGGALWVGTRGGLARLDDGQWQVYTKADSGLPDNNVRALAVGDGALWVGTAGGLARLENGGRWLVYSTADSDLPDDDVRALAVADGALWVGTRAGGLARLEDGRWQIRAKDDSGLPDDDVRALAVAAGALWVGTGGGGLARFADGRWQVYSTADGGGLPDNDAVALAAADGALWIGMEGGGLARLADGQWRVYATAGKDQPIDQIAALAADGDVLWAGTRGGELVRFADGTWEIHDTADSNLLGDGVQALAAADGVVWTGTSGGLARFANDKWQTYTVASGDLPDNDVRELAIADGAVWVATADGGLTRLADGEPPQVYTRASSGLPSDIIQALAAADGALWVGTRGGLARFSEGQWRVYTKADNGLPADNVLALAVTKDGLWVGTAMGGLARLSGDAWQVYKPADSGLPELEVLALAATDDALWVGTGGGGLARLADGQCQIYTPANSGLLDDDVPLLAAADGVLWIGTRGSGLARFEPPKARPEIVTIVGAGDGADEISINQTQHVIAARAFDPSYLTHENLFRFDWTLRTSGALGSNIIDRMVSRVAYYTARFKEDGRYTLNVVAIDRYGNRSDPREIKIAVSLPKASPWRDRAIDIGKATGVALLLYFLAVFPLILLYPHAGWARTMLNSGFFSRFPILHRLILNAGWSRRRLFHRLASRDSEQAAVPDPYIPQFVFRRGQAEPLPVGDDASSLRDLLGPTNRALLLARSGTGKSVLLQRTLQVCARAFLHGSYPYLPILIDLRTSPVASRSVEQLLRDALKGGQVELPDDQLDFLIAKGGFLLLIDSVNEAPAQAVAAAFHPFLNRDTDNAVIMASQVDVLERADMPAFNLAEVTPELARQHLAKAVGRDIWDALSPDAQALTRNPQDLTLLIEVVKALGPAKVPTHRAELYRAILAQDGALADWIETGDPGLGIVYALAFHMFGEERVLPIDRLREWLLKEMQARGGDQKQRLNELMDRIARSSLFREETAINLLGQATPVIGFRHELIGKFLASRHLRPAIEQRNRETLDAWVELSRDVRWADVFCFAIDELSDSRALNAMLEWLLAQPNDVQVRIVAYAIGTREDGIHPGVRQAYAAAKLDEDLQRTPALRAPRAAA